MRRGLAALLMLCGCGARPASPPDAGVTVRYPAVPSSGGPVLVNATLVSVTFAADARADAHDAFTRWLSDSGWLLARGAEYGVRTVAAGSPVRLTDTLPATVTDAQLRALLPLAPGALYLVWLPSGVAALDRHDDRTCESNPGTGYHDATDVGDVPYVVVPACPPRFSAMFDVEASMHLDGARLALDAMTNPVPRNAPAFVVSDAATGWTALGAEVGDFCWGRFTQADGHTLQRVWSNAAVARGEEPCVPAPAAAAFGVTVEPAGRRSLQVGQSIELTVTGWSASAVDDWRLEATPWVGDFAIQATLDRSTLNAGQAAALTLRVPYPVPVGTVGAVLLRSIGTTDTPLWPVAFLVK